MHVNVKVGTDTHVIERITLGDVLLLKQHFGITSLGYIEDHLDDPAVIAGLVYIGMRRSNPSWEHARLMNEVQDVDIEALDFADGDAPASADPKAGAPVVTP